MTNSHQGRKPKNAVPEAAPTAAAVADIAKPKRVRKPRDPNAPPVQRRRKTKDAEENTNGPTEIKFAVHPENVYRGPAPATENSAPFQKGFAAESEAIPNLTSQTPISFFNPHPPPPPPKPAPAPPPPQAVRTSGQNYDPIRSNYDPVRENVMPYNSYNPGNPQGSPGLPPSINRASASPSISSLVDPPNQPSASPSTATQSFFIHHQQARLQRDERPPSVPPSPTTNRFAPPPVEPSPNPTPQVPSPALSKKAETLAVNPSVPPTIAKKSMASGSTATSSAAASPKPPKLKDAKDTYPTPPPLPGSGLLQLGGPNDGTEFRAPTVIINIPMNGETNKYINFTRLAEEQYGWDAMHPRAAAQRDRLARVAVVSAALERNGSGKESGDEMSLDSEGEGSNVEMGGMSDGRTGTDGGPKKRKRKMKEDEYDKDDGFVDDSELLWEEQAAAAIDGFFVYSGPLVPEAEKPASENRYVQPSLSSNLTNTSQGRWCTEARSWTWQSWWNLSFFWWPRWKRRGRKLSSWCAFDGTWLAWWLHYAKASYD
jgi:hypothetical protein